MKTFKIYAKYVYVADCGEIQLGDDATEQDAVDAAVMCGLVTDNICMDVTCARELHCCEDPVAIEDSVTAEEVIK